MNHTHYPELTLTMLDTDALPVGRHTWKMENNACNQGETSTQVLVMSACQESEFTCDDGKCVNITQRCNNIEVICRWHYLNSSEHIAKLQSNFRIVMMLVMRRTVGLWLLILRNILNQNLHQVYRLGLNFQLH